MARLDEDGSLYRCDRCKKEFCFSDAFHSFYAEFVWNLFARLPKPDLPDFCESCCSDVAPLVFALRDAHELRSYVNKLEKAIKNVQRNQNHRPTSYNAG